MKISEILTEGKKDRRDVKRTVKPRNPVAHAAQKVAKGSGTHKDKKNTIPRKQKHKTAPVVGEDVKQRLDAHCWKNKHKEGTKMKGGIRVNNCVPNENVEEKLNTPFAGAKVGQKEGPAGQWRNDGPSKNRPARKGDLVGGM